ncbi:MAG: glycoside hydrolase family 38 C-terminal domain-containing protein [Phycisphaeraceae bacterium]
MMTPSDPPRTQQRARRLLNDVLRPAIFTDHVPLEVGVHQCAEPVGYDHAIRQSFTSVDLGWTWGPVWSTAWFRLRGQVPVAFGNAFRVLFDTRTEALCWWDGAPYQGVELHRQDIKLPESVQAGDDVELYVEAACNHMLGVADEYGDDARMGELPRTQSGTLRLAHLARYHAERAAAVVELELLLDLANTVPANTPRHRRVNEALRDVVNSLHTDRLDATLPAARKLMHDALTVPNAGDANTAYCIGNAHIDLAWLWPIRETRRKASRTFSTVLRYMERHPDYTFMQSQAQLYEWVRQHYPALFEQIRQRVKEGRWEVGGGTWVEPDCNVPSGESLVRQFLVGIDYFAKHFGVKQTYLWQPDVFGYCAALPQILKLAGLDVFFSQKISWSQYNKFPHHSFRWVGIDGSSVVSHFFPADTYIGNNLPQELQHGDTNYQEAGRCPLWLQAYGWGDGGGGPTEEMIARVDRLGDCAGLPKTRHSRVDTFAAELLKRQDQLPQWVGELYLELHRGTYTTQAFAKKGNRLGERLLQDVEIAQSMHTLAGRSRTAKQRARLDELWKLLLLNQFHDILPGSSIGWVYDDARRDYHTIMTGGEDLLRDAVSPAGEAGEAEGEKAMAVLNTSGSARDAVVELPEHVTAPTLQHGQQRVPTQQITTITGETRRLARLTDLPGTSLTPLTPTDAPAAPSTSLTVDELRLENEHLRVLFNDLGQVISLIHKASGREAIAPDPPDQVANQFVLYEDLPGNHDAWDVDLGYLDKAAPVTTATEHEITERGPVRAAITFRRPLGQASTLVQRVQLAADSRYVEFVTHVDWHESHQFLRVLHPVDVHADHASYEIQFGHLRRPNHFNTSWDYARFEVPAQRWMDLSEPGFGVTMVNDCKYGHSCLGNVMGLSLLRSPKSPDPEADMGEHVFRYALLPHAGFEAAEAVAAAESINQPPRVLENVAHIDATTLVQLPARCGVVLDTLKPAEDGDGLIARLYECRGARTACDLRVHPSVVKIEVVDLLEQPLGEAPLACRDATVRLDLRPFQILTLRLKGNASR